MDRPSDPTPLNRKCIGAALLIGMLVVAAAIGLAVTTLVVNKEEKDPKVRQEKVNTYTASIIGLVAAAVLILTVTLGVGGRELFYHGGRAMYSPQQWQQVQPRARKYANMIPSYNSPFYE